MRRANPFSHRALRNLIKRLRAAQINNERARLVDLDLMEEAATALDYLTTAHKGDTNRQ